VRLPFTNEQFFDVFRRYNEAVWPNQWLLFLLALLAIVQVAAGGRNGRSVAGTLGFLWLWMAVAYHFAFSRKVNPAATGFALLFAVEGLLLMVRSAKEDTLAFRIRSGVAGTIGASLVAYALVLYPLIGYAIGHRYPASPTFGLPCPTTIFTLGILLWGTSTSVGKLAVIPLIWALIGSQAAFSLGIWEDLGLTASAALFIVAAWRRRIRISHPNLARGY
jgi:Family of unknown function (DUF6064)